MVGTHSMRETIDVTKNKLVALPWAPSVMHSNWNLVSTRELQSERETLPFGRNQRGPRVFLLRLFRTD
jgi:hypothetical protein